MTQARFTLIALAPAVALFAWAIAQRFVTEEWLKGPIGFFSALGVALVLVAVRWSESPRKASRGPREQRTTLEAALSAGRMDLVELPVKHVAVIESVEGDGWVVDVGERDELVLLWTEGLKALEDELAPKSTIRIARVGEVAAFLSTEGAPVDAGPRFPIDVLGEALAGTDAPMVRFRGKWSTLESDLEAAREVRAS